MRFRLNVRKTKCGECDVITLVENNINTTLHLLCPICAGELENMEDEITVSQEGIVDKYHIGDIVRFKRRLTGLYEITGVYDTPAYQYTVTNNECDSEHYAKHSDLIFVCYKEDREDI